MPCRFCRPLVGKKLDHCSFQKPYDIVMDRVEALSSGGNQTLLSQRRGRKHDEAVERVGVLFVLPDKFFVAICGRHKQWQWQLCRLVYIPFVMILHGSRAGTSHYK